MSAKPPFSMRWRNSKASSLAKAGPLETAESVTSKTKQQRMDFMRNNKSTNPKSEANSNWKEKCSKPLGTFHFQILNLFRISCLGFSICLPPPSSAASVGALGRRRGAALVASGHIGLEQGQIAVIDFQRQARQRGLHHAAAVLAPGVARRVPTAFGAVIDRGPACVPAMSRILRFHWSHS